jgi:hypothetical protein
MEVARQVQGWSLSQTMTTASKKEQASNQYGLTLTQKILYGVAVVALILVANPLIVMLAGPASTVALIVFAAILAVVTWFVSAGWTFKLELTGSEIKIRDNHRETVVPLDKLGMVVRNGKMPLIPTIWLVLRGTDVGHEIPARGVDPRAAELIEAFRKRNPGKKITYVPVPGGYLRSMTEFVGELKRRIPPLTVDDRLGGK